MQYAKIQSRFTRSVVFKDADMAARGCWLTLHMYCADQENRGRIVGCKLWNDRQWFSRTDCMRADVDHLIKSELGTWDGDDLALVGYDLDGELHYHEVSERNRQRAVEAHRRRQGDVPPAPENPAAGNSSQGDRDCRRHDPDLPPASKNGAAGKKVNTDAQAPEGAECRRQPEDVPAAVPAAANNGAAGSVSGCPPSNHPSIHVEAAAHAARPQGATAGGGGGGGRAPDRRTATAAAGAPASRAAPGGRIDVGALVEEFGLHSGEKYRAGWVGLFQHQAQCRSADEARRFLRFAVGVRRKANQPARLPSHLAPLVDAWVENHRGAAAEGAA